ncbi:hypothetical protein GPJ56_004059 [Histomonas meleagridis]|uniref:uncharacterized protein n=1 Tax=Histomonas meleagridis TaxID=135588 RepID=UPI00355A36BB|nr:hypothetical protein GPJ56_004059 [Histomonas meleagridis]KAH0800587.1 hypothetical protein GO595_006340 [Histomonas meleagridis]
MSWYDYPRERIPRSYSPRGYPDRGNTGYFPERSASKNQSQMREYNPPPPSNNSSNHKYRDIPDVPEFNREKLQAQKDVILQSIIPIDDFEQSHPLNEILQKSVANQQKIVETLKELTTILGSADGFISNSQEIVSAEIQAEIIRNNLDTNYQFAEELSGQFGSSIDDFFPNV